MLVGGVEVGCYGNLTCAALARSSYLNGYLMTVTRQVDNIQGSDDTLADTLALTKEEAEKIYNEIRVEPLVSLMADAIFSGLSRESDKDHETLANKGREMDFISVRKNNVTMTAASNALAKIGIKVSVSTLRRDSQRPVDEPMPMRGPP